MFVEQTIAIFANNLRKKNVLAVARTMFQNLVSHQKMKTNMLL